jgi:hypothetical protein
MSDNNNSLLQRENQSSSPFTKFLWWLSTAEKELIADAIVDRNRYEIIGMTVLATWAFATLAWTYFFTTVISNLFLAIVLGIFMGLVILTIDRALIKGITKSNRNKAVPLIFRGILALTIGTFMAQPAILYLFDKEVKLQISIDNEKKKQAQQAEVLKFFSERIQSLRLERQQHDTELNSKYEAVTDARKNYLAESDGSGGTGKIGIEQIALAKKAEYQKLEAEYQQLSKELQPKINNIDKQLASVQDSMTARQQEFSTFLNEGFLTRIEALNNLIKDHPALQFRYYLILMILLLIELMPVIAKTLLPTGTYDERVALREDMEREIARSNSTKERDLKELYNSIAHEHDADTIRAFFAVSKEHREERLRSFTAESQRDKNSRLDDVWKRMKMQLLAKQEN